ncbi:MAG TPA: family 20 glycosylhydrolase [Acidimicrobiales bacterium]|nr:family 20 glycosylhydrolase [Acidimicrobiales bacterium]
MSAAADPGPALLPPPRQANLGRARVALPAGGPEIVVESGHRPEGYRLRTGTEGVRISASDQTGVARARATLAQLQDGSSVVEADVTDWPDFTVRGLMLDISRDKVPSMDTLRWLVDVMAAWKLNHLELYTEHTYAYPGHDEVWRNASPMTAAEVEELDGYCAERHVELTANQNCLGHMERWLAHERYRPLAVAPAGWPDHLGLLHHPTTMDPSNPAALELTRSLLAELLPRMRSRRAHVGLDEPWELPPERAGDYGAYISALRAAPELADHEMLVWGDIVALHPELAPGLPPGVTVCEWGYEADHPFADRCRTLADAGRPFWVCPGTSSWDSLLGRWSNARENCLAAATEGLAHGAGGYLVTDWGDNGHLQPLPVSLPGLAAAAAAAWNAPAAADADFSGAVAAVLGSAPAARALLRMGDAHLAVRPQVQNFAAVVVHLIYPRLRVGQGLTEGLDAAQLDAYEDVISGALPALRDLGEGSRAGPVGPEMALVADIARLAVADARGRLAGDGSLRSVDEAVRRHLADTADALAAAHVELWTARNRPGGREDSADHLRHLAACYRAGEAAEFVPAWQFPL